MLRIRVPATSANLGPGFDCLGLALTLYNYITVELDKPFEINVKGDYTHGIPTDESNLIWRTMRFLWDKVGFFHPQMKLTFENNIPPARGLGSSSAAIVGGLFAANVISGNQLSQEELVNLANELEGHPDNITPALLGGLTLSVVDHKSVIARVIDSKPQLKAVVAIPDYHVKTEDARRVLPAQVSRADAVYNISRCSLLLDAFVKHDYHLLQEAMKDQIHQKQRATLIPGMTQALSSAIEAGAYGSALSGSGPTILALVSIERQEQVIESLTGIFAEHHIDVKSHVLDIDSTGTTILL